MRNRNRLDHYVPQGYLQGFIGPSGNGRLSVFDKQKGSWFESGTPGVGAIKGFYDYSEGSESDQTADDAFGALETTFPKLRRELLGSGFANWNKRLGTLLRFAQMLRARSLLFREQALSRNRNLPFLRIEEILAPQPGESGTRIRYSRHVPSEAELLNKTITDMRTEIASGAAWMSDLHWCLRTTSNVEDPFVTCDGPVITEGRARQVADALRDRETLVFFPLCWQACLVGSPAKFDVESGALALDDMKKLRALYLKSANRFVFSPRRI
jgi:hypothetical protein